MVRKYSLTAFFKIALVASIALSIAQPTFAQSTASGEQKSNSFSGPRKQLATIIFAGLGGAILGLSTLSFYGRPQDNLRNIAFGAGAGIILGTVVVTYKAATNPSELYGANQRPYDLDANEPDLLAVPGLAPGYTSAPRLADSRPQIEKEIDARETPKAPRGAFAFSVEF